MKPAPSALRALWITALGASLAALHAGCGDDAAAGAGAGGAGAGAGSTAQGSGGAGGSGGAATSAGGGTSSSTSTGACDSGEACVPAVPADWQGPVVVYSGGAGATLPDCPAGFGAPAIDAYADLGAAAPASCTCSCGAPTGGTCASASQKTVHKIAHDVAACGHSCSAVDDLFAGECLPVIQGTCGGQAKPKVSQSITVSPPDLGNAACAPALDKVIPEAPAFGARVRVCAASSPAACASGVCAATDHGAFGAAACVLHAGDVPCPAGPYAARTVVHASVADSRDCAPCACGPVAGAKCEGAMTAHASPGCGASLGSYPIPGCVPWLPEKGTTHVRFDLTVTGGSCAPSGGEPTGDVAPEGATTICCAP